MNLRPNSEILEQTPDTHELRPDFPHKKRLGILLENYADSLLEPKSNKILILSDLRSPRV